MTRSFEELVAEANAVSVQGWDFSWIDGRGTQPRTSWQYSKLIGERLEKSKAAIDYQTGGGEVLANATTKFPPVCVAVEGWHPNFVLATRLLNPLGIVVVKIEVGDPTSPLPFAEESFDLFICRHPIVPPWKEIARVLQPGGTFLGQLVTSYTKVELIEFFLGPQPKEVHEWRDHEMARKRAEAAGLEIVQVKTEGLRTEFFDVGAVIYFLRKIVTLVPGFTVEKYMDKLKEMHEHIQKHGSFVTIARRALIEARKPLKPCLSNGSSASNGSSDVPPVVMKLPFKVGSE